MTLKLSEDNHDALKVGWPEMGAGLIAMSLVAYLLPIYLLRPIHMSVAVGGVIAAFLSGLAGLAGFFAAAHIRGFSWKRFGVQAVSLRWLCLGLAGGLVALVGKAILVPVFVALTGADTDVQAGYVAGSSGAGDLLLFTAIGMIVLTPIGEEFLFRGVFATHLLRYGRAIGVIGSALLFGLAHGMNAVLPAAVVVGIIAAELRWRSNSVWPGVIAHATNNAITVGIYAMFPALF